MRTEKTERGAGLIPIYYEIHTRDCNVAGVRTTALRTATCLAQAVSNTNSLIPREFAIFSQFSESSFRTAI